MLLNENRYSLELLVCYQCGIKPCNHTQWLCWVQSITLLQNGDKGKVGVAFRGIACPSLSAINKVLNVAMKGGPLYNLQTCWDSQNITAYGMYIIITNGNHMQTRNHNVNVTVNPYDRHHIQSNYTSNAKDALSTPRRKMHLCDPKLWTAVSFDFWRFRLRDHALRLYCYLTNICNRFIRICIFKCHI